MQRESELTKTEWTKITSRVPSSAESYYKELVALEKATKNTTTGSKKSSINLEVASKVSNRGRRKKQIVESDSDEGEVD